MMALTAAMAAGSDTAWSNNMLARLSRQAGPLSLLVTLNPVPCLCCSYANSTGYAMDPHPNLGATVGRVSNRCAPHA
jgi:hypothetical protein